ncbi:hypothetical protein ASE35_13955 [Lysobacter sp. Root916]|nr:hypothetical protein ASE35_13955 [Lysobacter sp. Root916]
MVLPSSEMPLIRSVLFRIQIMQYLARRHPRMRLNPFCPNHFCMGWLRHLNLTSPRSHHQATLANLRDTEIRSIHYLPRDVITQLFRGCKNVI